MKIARYGWFHEELTKANGLEWLPLISLNTSSSHSAVLEILVDQIVFQSAIEDIRRPLTSSYRYLQSLGVTLQPSTTEILTPTSRMFSPRRLFHLQEASLWLLFHSRSVRISSNDLLERPGLPWFATIGRKKLDEYGLTSAGNMRSFDFARYMTTGEWEEWEARLRIIAMGAALGGLKPCLRYGRARFVRDPDGLCCN
jgi:hypothetical protein